MAKYRVRENPRANGIADGEFNNPPAGHEFEWDGVSVDSDGDIVIWMDPAGHDDRYVAPEYVEPAPFQRVQVNNFQRVQVNKRAVTTEVVDSITLTLTVDQATQILNALDGWGYGTTMNEMFKSLSQALGESE